MFRIIASILLFSFTLLSCQSTDQGDRLVHNPPAIGFNASDSDPSAIEIADRVMKAMGGRENWDQTNYLSWNFFGNRKHIWNKQTGDIIIEGLKQQFRISMNIDSMEGIVLVNERNLTKSDSLDQWINKGKSWWINDSYWLFMPFKLKDSGLRLKHIGQDTLASGSFSEVLELTFKDVGDTPQNKYYVYIDTVDYLIKQWDFFPSQTDSIPRFSIPWIDYKQYDRIKLSGNRGRFALTEISASDTLSSYFD